MSWIDKVKDHVGSGITTSSTGTYTPPLLSQAAKDALDKAEMIRQQDAMHAAMMSTPSVYVGSGGGSYITSGGYINPIGARWSPREKILMRLNTPNGELIGFDYLEAAQLSEDKVVVFVVNSGKHCTIEDDAHLFPSDTLITQLRILRK